MPVIGHGIGIRRATLTGGSTEGSTERDADEEILDALFPRLLAAAQAGRPVRAEEMLPGRPDLPQCEVG